MKGREVAVHAVDETRVDRHRDVRTVERHLERGRVLSRLREEQHLLRLAVQRRAERAAEAAERLEERRHHLLAVGAIGQRAQIAERRLIELDGAAVAERHRRVREIGVREDAVDVGRRPRERAGGGENLLLVLAERVRGPPRDILDVEAIDLEPRFRGEEAIERRFAGAQELRLDERRLGGERGGQLHHLLLHALVRRVARVLIGQHACVRVEARQLLVERVQSVERVGQRFRRRGELALELAQLRQLGGELLLRCAPRGFVRIDVSEVPGVLLWNLRAVAFLGGGCHGHGRDRRNDRQRSTGRAVCVCSSLHFTGSR